MTFTVPYNGNPFPGLRSFEPTQAHLFFGREGQIGELISRLKQHRFLPIVGMSGSGKSSLVRAGLIPALICGDLPAGTSEWRIAVLRPGRNPMHELATTLCREFAVEESHAVLEILRGSSAGLARFAQQHLGNTENLLVFVDQFEELFRYREKFDPATETDDAAIFVKLLLAAAGESMHPLPGFDDLPIYVVMTMRSDFLGECSRFRGLPEALNQSTYLIPNLTRNQNREVIEGPIRIAGETIDPVLVQRLLNDLGDNPNQLPTLQHALMRTWEQSAPSRAQGKPISIADYEAVGAMAEAINGDADTVYQSLSTPDAAITRRLFQRLAQSDASGNVTRSPTPLFELVAITAADEADLSRIITVFQERGFLTVSRDEDPVVDITHESLIRGWRRLRAWVQEEAQSATIYRRLADTATLYSKHEASLLVDPQLQLTLNWHDEMKPNEAWAARYDSRFAQATEFLEQSRKEHYQRIKQQRKSARLRLTLLVLFPLLLLAIGALIFAIIQLKTTQAERDRSNRLLYDSNVYFASSAVASNQFTLARERLDELRDAGLRELRGFEWFYLWRAVHADEATLSGHSDSVRSVAFSPDGKTLASASLDGTVKLWDTVTRTEVATLSGHSHPVVSVAFSPDGKTLASGSGDNTVKLWDTVARKEGATLSGHSDAVWSVAFSPDGKTLASASLDGTVKLWDTAERKEVATLSGHSDVVWSVAFSPDGKTLASASGDKTVKLWDTAERKEVATLSGHFGNVGAVAFSPDGKTLASASLDETVRLWDTAERKAVATLSGHSDSGWTVAFSPDGKTLAFGSGGQTVKLWNIAAPTEGAFLSSHSGSVKSVAFSPDGRTLASASDDNTVMLWNTAARKEVATLSVHSGAVLSVAFLPDGKTLASASGDSDNTVRIWDTAARKEVATLSGHSDSVWSVAFSPDGKTLASASDDKTVKIWDTVMRKEVATLSGHSASVRAVAFSPDGKSLASASEDQTVKLWDTATHKEVATLSGHSDSVTSVVFSPDGKTLASASNDFTVKLWDTASRKEVATFSGHSSLVMSVAFSPDGKTLASASGDETVKLWDIASRKEVATLSGHSHSVMSVAFSPDGKTLASASGDETVKLWDIASRKEVATLSGHSHPVWSVAFSSDGKTLASGSDGSKVKLWFAATDEEVEERRRRGY